MANNELSEQFKTREVEIVRLMADGMSNREIASQLHLGVETVRWYAKQIYSKLDVSGREEASNRARELGILDEDILFEDDAPSQLPFQVELFIGRQQEIQRGIELFHRTRLLTLTGPGGTGKTRLSVKIAESVLDDFPDGIYFVDLSPITNENLVPVAIARAMDVFETGKKSIFDILKGALYGRKILLIVDNFEQVINAAPIISELLAEAPLVKMIVTSREALRVAGEQEYPVPPLSLPPETLDDEFDVLTQSEAVMLFVERVKKQKPNFELTPQNAPVIARICQRLDGLPLAIELAAARCKLLTPQAMLDRLENRLNTLTDGPRDAPMRQQTLRSAIEWSYNLLNDDERTLFARCAVFSSGRSLEAIEAICGHELNEDVLDVLASLIDKSLLYQIEVLDGEPRFMMLETIHEFARTCLDTSAEAEDIYLRHAQYFTEFAVGNQPEMRMANGTYWFRRFEIEHDNFRAVLQWSLEDGDIVLGTRLAAALYEMWYYNGYHTEGYRWTQAIVKKIDQVPIEFQGPFFLCASHFALIQGQMDIAKELGNRGIHAAETANDPYWLAWLYSEMSYVRSYDDYDHALALAQKAIEIFESMNHKPSLAQAWNTLGEITRSKGNYNMAKDAYERSLALTKETGEINRIRMMHTNLSFLALRRNDHKEALKLALEALQITVQMQNKYAMAEDLAFLAIAIASSYPEEAAQLYGTAEAALGRLGAFFQPVDKSEVERGFKIVKASLGEERFQELYEQGQRITLQKAVEDVLARSW